MLRLALLHGCGQKAGRYAQAAARVRGLKIAAIVNPDAAKRQDAAQALGGAIAAESLAELLDSHAGEVDGVLIHGTVAKRADLACRAAGAGKHVFIATPAAASVEEIDRIVAACRANSVAFVCGSHVRMRPSFAAVKAAVDSGKLGAPGLLRVHCWEPKGTDDPASGETRSRIVQLLDLALWMFPQPPTEIFVVGSGAKTAWSESLQIHLGFPEGGMALISLARTLPAGAGYETVSLIGSTGAAYADEHNQKQLVFRGDDPRAVHSDEAIPAIVSQLREFQAAIQSARDPAAAGDAMKAALKLTEAAWTSLTTKEPVALS